MEDDVQVRIGYARKQARLIIKRAKLATPPVLLNNIVKFIQTKDDLRVFPKDLGKKISGIQLEHGGTTFIAYNLSEHEHRQRFTLAHEIGHFVMGHTGVSNFDSYDLNTKSPYEIEANAFAAELLMPLDMIKKDYQELHNPKQMATKYLVSEVALWKRLLDCKLIK